MKLKSLGLISTVCLLAAACTDARLVNNVSSMTPKESGFKASLHRYYVDLGKAELDEGDFYDTGIFARRAQAAAMGKEVDPDLVWDRDFTDANFETLSNQRQRLMKALDGGGRKRIPDTAAKAQTQFDCWAQELEENTQPDDIKNCRDGYFASIEALEKGLKPKRIVKKPEPPKPTPAPRPAPQIVRNFLLFFGFDSAQLTDDARATIQTSVDISRQIPASLIEVTGHTDSAGSNLYNLALSKRRVQAVQAELFRLGIAAAGTTISWEGERQALIQTEDGVREPQNRRVEITLK